MRRLTECGAVVLLAGLCVVWAAPAGAQEVRFTKTVVDTTFRSEGVATGDINHDGKTDILAGDVWYEAPAWKIHEIRKVGTYKAAGGYSDCFANFAQDVNGDGWIDSIVIGFPGRECFWYENPKNAAGHWKRRTASRSACNETPIFVDLLGDGTRRAVFGTDGKMTWYSVGRDPEGLWDAHAVSGAKAPGTERFSHGLGCGDVNGDGRNDIIVPQGWWEAPQDRKAGPWAFHKVPLGPNCADMHAYDVDGDGDSDIITSSAHGYGIWWFEQTPSGFKQHEIFKAFSQAHALHLVDMNGDGLKDLVTGKRYFAHNGKDPGGKEPAVLYWFELRRPGKGKVEFVPHKIDDDSGVGTQFEVVDFNGDGRPDIVTSNKKGVHVFLQAGGGAPAAPAGVSLFDGKTFDGWEGNLKSFRIADGAIVGGTLKNRIPRNEFLCTTREYSDFELRLKVKLTDGKGNAGIQIRSRRIPNHHEMIGYQADMAKGIWGALYDESRRRKVLARPDAKALAKVLKPDGWNDYVMRCEGRRIRFWLNGYQTVDYTEPDAGIPQTGLIGLQIHGGAPSEVWYKDITITVLSR